MKKIMSLALTLSFSLSVMANTSPLENLRSDLNSSVAQTENRLTLVDLKTKAEESSTDIGVAFENYLIAKKRVNIARAQLNPLNTGHALGIALGLSYLWAPIAVEAVLSIPTKLYNISSNKSLAEAARYNSKEARDAIKNEVAHLYFDVLTHEVLLKSLDREIDILLYHTAELEKTAASSRKAKIDYNKASILVLKMERIDIYNLYLEEMAALKTLLSINPDVDTKEFAHIQKALKSEFLSGLDLNGLQDYAVVTSNKVKKHINLHRAAEQNVKSVQWSILSFSGINFSYKSRVRAAKIDEGVAELNKESAYKTVANESVLQAEKLEAAIGVSESYSDISDASLSFFEDNFDLFKNGVKPEEYAIESSIGAIRDFRSRVIAHYAAWSSLDDLQKSLSYSAKVKPEEKTLQEALESSSYYGVSSDDYKVVVTNSYDSVEVKIKSSKLSIVEEVEYDFNDNSLGKRTSSSEKRKFEINVSTENTHVSDYSGVATIVLKNGHEFKVKF